MLIAASLLGACTTALPPGPAPQSGGAAEPLAAQPFEDPRATPRGPALTSQEARHLIESDVATYGSPGVLAEARSAATAILARRSPSFPYVSRQPDGSSRPDPPSVAVAVRTSTGWDGWRGNGARFSFDQEAGRELDRLLAADELWREPGFPPVSCTDPGGVGAIIRHQGRERVMVQPCGSQGLNGRIAEIVLAGRVRDWRGTPPEALPQGLTLRRLPEEAQQQFRFNSGLRDARTIVIRSDAEWLGQWRRITSGRSSTPPLVDFSRDMLLLAAMGTRPTGGYSIVIRRVVDLGSALEVHVVHTSPGRRCGTTAALTEPVDVALIPATDKPVRWVEHQAVSDCP